MLVVTRRPGEEVEIGGTFDGQPTLYDARGRPVTLTVSVIRTHFNKVWIGIRAPKQVPVNRMEVADRIHKEQEIEALTRSPNHA